MTTNPTTQYRRLTPDEILHLSRIQGFAFQVAQNEANFEKV